MIDIKNSDRKLAKRSHVTRPHYTRLVFLSFVAPKTQHLEHLPLRYCKYTGKCLHFFCRNAVNVEALVSYTLLKKNLQTIVLEKKLS